MIKQNIIKEVKEKYNLSYAELAEITGAKESTLIKSASTGEVGDIIRNAIKWYIQSREKEEKLNNMEHIKVFFRDFLDLK